MRNSKKTQCVLFAAMAFSTIDVAAVTTVDAPSGDIIFSELLEGDDKTDGYAGATFAMADAAEPELTIPAVARDHAVLAALSPLPFVPSPPLCPDSDEAIDPSIAGFAPALDRIEEVVVGAASFYDFPQRTASGEDYDPDSFTAAAQLLIRDKFGGIKFGRLYRPAYAIAEYEDKKIIVRFNDVGPLYAGRKFDLSRAAMAHFDPGLEKGVLRDVKMTPLPIGRSYATGPITDVEAAAIRTAVFDPPVQAAPGEIAPVVVAEALPLVVEPAETPRAVAAVAGLVQPR